MYSKITVCVSDPRAFYSDLTPFQHISMNGNVDQSIASHYPSPQPDPFPFEAYLQTYQQQGFNQNSGTFDGGIYRIPVLTSIDVPVHGPKCQTGS